MSLNKQLIEAVRRYCWNVKKHNKNIKEISFLLKEGADPNAVDYGWYHEPTVLLIAAEEGKKEVIELLLHHGADINSGGGREGEKPNKTPLHGAIEKKHEEVAIFLTEKGADIHAENEYGSTPLHDAAYEGLGQLVKLLLDKGARVNVRSIHNNTPLHRAMHPNADPQTVRLLLEHGSDVNIEGNHGDTLVSSYTIWEKPLESFFLLLLFGADISGEYEYIREKINNTPELKNCLTALKKIKAMPHLGKLVGTNIKKENAKVIRKYINNGANQKALIAEFKTISEKYGSDKQLAFIPRCLLNAAKHVNLAFLRSYIDKNTMVSCLHESKNDISIIKKKGSETEVISKMLPICASKKIVSYLNNDTYKNVLLALSKRTDELLIELEETVHRPKSTLTKAQPEAASSRSKCL